MQDRVVVWGIYMTGLLSGEGGDEEQLRPPPVLQVKVYGSAVESSVKRAWFAGLLIVGAGPAGLATAACLKARGVPALVLERERCAASSWKLRTYERLRLHLPKKYCALPLMPFPKELPEYPTRQQFVDYLDCYVDRFALAPLYGVEVAQAEYDPSLGFWRVRAAAAGFAGGSGGGVEFVSRWLVVATGENAEAVWPETIGVAAFHGKVLHTSCYDKGDEHRGERVLVVGCGNSGMEVALDLCDNDAKLHILPRDIFGISTFGLSMFLLKWLPVKAADALLLSIARLVLGDTGKYGIARPSRGPLELKTATGKTPVLDVGTFAKIKSGQIKGFVQVVPDVNQYTSRGAEFVDGTHREFDSIILATGYKSNVTSWLKVHTEKQGAVIVANKKYNSW
ncbi:indole-3-pyruvate monooxygenase YUCCA2-like isoform X3 [Zingiber officinale]|uniref:indole-3-pyruvate monooxygenase YUCCA2-like isoform X3 n=1 Tax=Zingiber officinale TaxID=94328 RepID=UPI001C4D54C4|nr:indole-3-pyruvate monooxygenase YUCCA2-like isoform X3 [Zingiber officinale]XP_042420793.1 indole-3-pyruvate monooxygenase YUCCA2-like isoform X3 [Zingiber officinale]